MLDVGGSHATAASVILDGPSGEVRDAEPQVVDPAGSAEDLLETFAAPALRLLSRLAAGGAPRPERWVVGMPGPFDYASGVGRFGEVGKFDSLRGVSVREGLARRLGVEESGIRFLNDAAAYGIGEWAFGSPTRADRHVCITLGTGVGSSFLDRGRVVDAGPDVPPRGWAYLLEFDGRPLEETVSTRAIVRHHAQRTGAELTVKQIAEAAARGDADAVAVLDRAMFALGSTLAPWIDSFAAERLTIGGSIARSWPVLAGALADGLSRRRATPDLDLVPSSLLDHAPVLGAAVWLDSRDMTLDSSSDSLRSDHR